MTITIEREQPKPQPEPPITKVVLELTAEEWRKFYECMGIAAVIGILPKEFHTELFGRV